MKEILRILIPGLLVLSGCSKSEVSMPVDDPLAFPTAIALTTALGDSSASLTPTAGNIIEALTQNCRQYGVPVTAFIRGFIKELPLLSLPLHPGSDLGEQIDIPANIENPDGDGENDEDTAIPGKA